MMIERPPAWSKPQRGVVSTCRHRELKWLKRGGTFNGSLLLESALAGPALECVTSLTTRSTQHCVWNCRRVTSLHQCARHMLTGPTAPNTPIRSFDTCSLDLKAHSQPKNASLVVPEVSTMNSVPVVLLQQLIKPMHASQPGTLTWLCPHDSISVGTISARAYGFQGQIDVVALEAAIAALVTDLPILAGRRVATWPLGSCGNLDCRPLQKCCSIRHFHIKGRVPPILLSLAPCRMEGLSSKNKSIRIAHNDQGALFTLARAPWLSLNSMAPDTWPTSGFTLSNSLVPFYMDGARMEGG